MIRTTRIMKQTTILGLLIALLLIPAFSEARVISVQMSAPTIAFGGYSWPGVGQYEKITGVAYAEVDPADHRNSIIVDIGLAQPQAAPGQPGKTPSGKVAYLLNFYILKPVNLNQVDRKLNGYGKMMYEPPNRGGKTWTALGRVTGGGNDPAAIGHHRAVERFPASGDHGARGGDPASGVRRSVRAGDRGRLVSARVRRGRNRLRCGGSADHAAG